MSMRECPSCAQRVEAGDPDAVQGSNFCPKCGEPLFWQPIVEADEVPAVAAVAGAEQAARGDEWAPQRMPEVRGRVSLNYWSCWNCHERNESGGDPSLDVCWLCGKDRLKPIEQDEPTEDGKCVSPGGEVARKPFDVPSWVLVLLGLLLAFLTFVWVHLRFDVPLVLSIVLGGLLAAAVVVYTIRLFR